MDHPDTWRLLVTPSASVVGYWHFVPLFNEEFDRAARGELLDSDITTDKVQVFELAGSYSAYFVTFGLKAQYRRSRGFKLLMHSFFESLRQLATNGVYIDQFCANAYTDSGIALCRTFGLSKSGMHYEKGTIFRGSAGDLLASPACLEYRELKQLYSDRSLVSDAK